MSLLSELNPEQREAVSTTDGPLLVLAGAGSGKTRVITYRIAYLINEKQVDPSRILAVTFTNKAAEEMKDRVFKLVGKQKGLIVSTFHAFGVRFLKEESMHAGLMQQFSIYSDKDTEGLLKNIIIEFNLDESKYPVRLMAYLISKAKTNMQGPDELSALEDVAFKQVYKAYESRLKSLNAVDFDDLIYLPVRILSEVPEVKEKWNNRFRYFLVDEYQDTNDSQYLLMKLLTAKHNNICAVGDDDQSIYAFRGANVNNILRFEHDYPNTKVIALSMNYRSASNIVEAAYGLISHNKARHKKAIRSSREEGKKISVIDALDAREEAELLSAEIFDTKITDKILYHDQAILCRTNTQMKIFEEVFREKNIPYRLIGGFSFFDRKEVKDMISYLKLMLNPLDNLSFMRTVNFPKRGIGEKTLEELKTIAQLNNISLFTAIELAHTSPQIPKPALLKLQEYKELIEKFEAEFKQAPLSKVMTEFLKEIEIIQELERLYKEESLLRIKSVEDFIKMTENFQKRCREQGEFPNLENFLNSLSLLNNTDSEEEEKTEHKIPVMTIHAAKGLEFDAVYIPGFEEKFIPHDRSIDEGEHAIEEERRLAYVAITRAKKKLTISYAASRTNYGFEEMRNPSRFLNEIPEHLLDYEFSAKPDAGKSQDEIALDYLQKFKNLLSS